MTRTSRTATVLVAAVALAVPAGLAGSAAAAAKPQAGTPSSTVKGQSKQLLKAISGRDDRLVRLTTSSAVTRLADDHELALVTNIEEARGDLAELRTNVEAADSTVDTRAARAALRSFRVENFRLVANVLKRTEGLADAAAADPVAVEHLAAAESAALEIDAYSSKGDIREAREHVDAAETELDDETESEPETETETDTP
jgi:hypothetical protein